MTPHRIDDNQREIVGALRAVGASVQSLAEIGQGCPDLLVFYKPQPYWPGLYLMEVKSRNGKLTVMENIWQRSWGGPVHVVRSVEEALAVIGIGG